MRRIAAEFHALNMRRNVQIDKGETEIHHLMCPLDVENNYANAKKKQ